MNDHFKIIHAVNNVCCAFNYFFFLLFKVPRPVQLPGSLRISIDTQILIGLVHEREALWNPKHPDWCNRTQKTKKWASVAKRVFADLWHKKEDRTILSE